MAFSYILPEAIDVPRRHINFNYQAMARRIFRTGKFLREMALIIKRLPEWPYLPNSSDDGAKLKNYIKQEKQKVENLQAQLKEAQEAENAGILPEKSDAQRLSELQAEARK